MIDLHYHKCPDCGLVWRHAYDPFCSTRAEIIKHTCSRCGCHTEEPSDFGDTYRRYTPTVREIRALNATQPVSLENV